MRALIGSTGFVGGVLGESATYDLKVHRSNLQTLAGRSLERVVCAGLPAAKWLANREPEADLANVAALQSVLRTVEARSFVLISTVDVYPSPRGCDETDDPHGAANHAYGRHRLQFEGFVREHFPHAVILRLPALFGPGLKKNVMFDLLNNNCLEAIQPDSSFQWYPLAQLGTDIERSEAAGLTLANLCPEPLTTRELLARFFPDTRVGAHAGPAVHYDLRTVHAGAFDASGPYIMNRHQVLDSMDTFLRAAA